MAGEGGAHGERRWAQSLAALEARARAAPGDAWLQLAIGQTLQHLGRPFDALLAYERACALDAGLGAAWTLRGHLLRQAGRLADAGLCFERAIACGEDAATHRYFLGALGRGALPDAAPAAFVRELFDEYAEGFASHLVETLNYRGHLEVTAPLPALMPGGAASALDLGCGSGLAAPLLRPLARRLAGVDLSPRMVAAASATGLYDELHVGELVAFLGATPQRHELVIACDVFIYLGDLAPAFDAVARVLAPGGVFGFSVEAGAADAGFDLLPSLRFNHSERYLRSLAAQRGLEVLRLERGPLRASGGEMIDGFFVHLRQA
jgi:predicted TPR repeat methyltransferase